MADELPVEEDGAVETPEVDYEKRWKDTHANWNTLNEQLSRFKSDPNAVLEFLQENHPDLLVDDEPEEEEPEEEPFDDTPSARELAELRKQNEELRRWQQDVENERGETRFNRDLQKELGDRQVNDRVKTWIKDRTAALGNNPKALKQAVEEWAEITGEVVESAKPKPKPKTHAVPRGEAVTGGKAWSDMTRQEALEAQVELARQLETQS